MPIQLGERGISTLLAVLITAIVVGIVVGSLVYVLKPVPPPKITRTEIESYLRGASVEHLEEILKTALPKETFSKLVDKLKEVTLGIEHFSIIEGTTWSGAHDRAAKRLTKLYPWLKYIKEEEVSPERSVPVAKDMIGKGADIVVGNAEFMGLPLKDIADDYPDVYFVSIIASDLSTKRNFIRYFPAQYQAMYLEGLVAGALTKTNKIGVVSGPLCVQNFRRIAAFYLGIKEANPNATLYVKYVGEWYNPPVEAEVARTLVDEYGVDVLTHYTDSVAPLKVAEEKGIWFIGKDMDIVGEYGWSTTDTVAVSFDTRWEVGYDKIIKEYLAGVKHPKRVMFIRMHEPMAVPEDNPILPGQTLIPIVDLQNNKKIGIEAISPKARPLIPDKIIKLIELRREQMLKGAWDPFTEYELVSGGTGIRIPELNLDVPPKGTVVKPAGVVPSDEFLLARLNFHLDGIVYLK